MKRFKSILLIAAATFAFSSKLLAGDPMQLPAKFELPAIDGGGKLTREQLQGKKVLIQFWASWCVGCSKVMEDLQPISTTGAGAQYLSVSLDENKDQARSFFTHLKDSVKTMQGKSWIDPDTKLATHLKIKSLPAIVLIDGNGKVLENLYGHPNAEQMKKIEAFFK